MQAIHPGEASRMSDQSKSMTKSEVAERLFADDGRLLLALIMVSFRKAAMPKEGD